MNRKLLRAVRASLQLAKQYAKDQRKTLCLVDQADTKVRRQRSTLHKLRLAPYGAGLRGDFPELLGLLRAWATGSYRVVPWKSLLLAIAAVIYFVNPFDLVPDFIPMAGLVDDVAVLGFVLKSLQKDLVRFHGWQQAQVESPRA